MLNITKMKTFIKSQVDYTSSNFLHTGFFKMKFIAEDSINYIIQSSNDLRNCYDVDKIFGTGSVVDCIDNNPILINKYYRVKLEDPSMVT